MEIIREPEFNLGTIKEADIYEEIYQIALSSEDKKTQLNAWLALANYVKDIETREERSKSMQDMMKSMASMYKLQEVE